MPKSVAPKSLATQSLARKPIAPKSLAPKSIADAVREVCLSFPDAAEVVSRGSPDYRVRNKTFGTYVVNHHGDGRVALWLVARQGAQQHYVGRDPTHYFIPPYVGPRGWLGVKLNSGLHWKDIAERVREAYEIIAPRGFVESIGKTITITPPTRGVDPEVFDPLSPPRIAKVVERVRKLCLALPEASEGLQFGNPVWRAGKKSFCTMNRYSGRLRIAAWVGTERQVAMTFERRYRIPSYTGGNGWIELDLEDEVNIDEIRELLMISYQHFALKRMLSALEK